MRKKINPVEVIAALRAEFGETVKRTQIHEYEASHGLNARSWSSVVRVSCPRAGKGLYRLTLDPAVVDAVASRPTRVATVKKPRPIAAPVAPVQSTVTAATDVHEPVSVGTITDAQTADTSWTFSANATRADVIARVRASAAAASSLCAVPTRSTVFVPFGDYDLVENVIASRTFHPLFITGLSGNGKTFQVEQACAATGREYLRVNITEETDEDDLLGGFRLQNGNTVFELGPVAIAMLRGAVLLLDEIDLGGNKILCLQPILEGRAVTLKKLGITLHPADGFTIVATANTKGRGSDDGRFVGTNLLNEAFLERFPITIEQAYPPVAVERKILLQTLAARKQTSVESLKNTDDATFCDTLAKWADAIRVTFEEGGIDDLISTRRLVHIVNSASLLTGPDAYTTAVTVCLNRFDRETKAKLLDFYSKLTVSTQS